MAIQLIAVKSVILGEPQVGKSAIRKLLEKGHFKYKTGSSYYDFSTINYSVELPHKENQTTPFYILELSDSTHTHRDRVSFYSQGTIACILVYDITEPDSLKELEKWFDVLKSHNQEKPLPVVLIRNKIDQQELDFQSVKQRELTVRTQIEDWTHMKLLAINFSAYTGGGLSELESWLRTIIENLHLIGMLGKAFDLYEKLKRKKSDPPSLEGVLAYLRRLIGDDAQF